MVMRRAYVSGQCVGLVMVVVAVFALTIVMLVPLLSSSSTTNTEGEYSNSTAVPTTVAAQQQQRFSLSASSLTSLSASPSSSKSGSSSSSKPPPKKRFAIFVAGQSNAFGLNGQSLGGYRFLNYSLKVAPPTHRPFLDLPEPGHPGVHDGPGEWEEPNPRARMVYTGSLVLESAESPVVNTSRRHYRHGIPAHVGDGMEAACPVQMGYPASLFVGGETVSWAFHVAKWLVEQHLAGTEDEVWVVGCSAGGGFTPVDYKGATLTWDSASAPNGGAIHNFYRDMEERAHSAIVQHDLTPLALMWQHGEYDSKMGMPGPVYAQHMDAMFRAFRWFLRSNNLQRASDPPLPVIVGRMGPKYRRLQQEEKGSGSAIDAAHRTVGQRVQNAAVVEADEATTLDQHIGDNVHFTADAHRTLGRDYATALLGLQNAMQPAVV